MIRQEGFFKIPNQSTQLFYQIWRPSSPKLWVFLTHGQGEHSECYHRFASFLVENSFALMAWDLRGHGRSSGKRGYIPHFLDYIQDWHSILKGVFQDIKEATPFVIMGHSLGGLITLRAILEFYPHFSRLPILLSSPFLGLSMPVPSWKKWGSKALYHLLPNVCLYDEIRHEWLTRDVVLLREYEKDPLRHHKISAPVFLGALEAQKQVIQTIIRFRENQFLLLMSNQDPIVSSKQNLLFFKLLSSPQKTLKVYNGATHEVLNDIIRDKVFEDVKSWLEGLIGNI